MEFFKKQMSPDSGDGNGNIKKVKNYKDSMFYRMLQGELEDKNYRSVLESMQNLSNNPLMDKKHANMMDVLIQAYEGGDH